MTSPSSARTISGAGEDLHNAVEHVEHLSRTVVPVWPCAVGAFFERDVHCGERTPRGAAVRQKLYLRRWSANHLGGSAADYDGAIKSRNRD